MRVVMVVVMLVGLAGCGRAIYEMHLDAMTKGQEAQMASQQEAIKKAQAQADAARDAALQKAGAGATK